MIKRWILLFICIAALFSLGDSHSPQRKKPSMERFFDYIKRGSDGHIKRNVTLTWSTSSPTEATTVTPETIKNFFSNLEKAVSRTVKQKLGYFTSTKGVHSTASLTEESGSVKSQATQSYKDPNLKITVHSVSTARNYPVRIGSIKGVPGVNFPNYTDIPLTSFTCSDKEYEPGFYADLECGCQVFHVCWPHRRESFLCPLGTTFNQALLACDYWYSTNCSLAPHYYNVNADPSKLDKEKGTNKTLSSMINVLLQENSASTPTVQTGESSKTASVTPETMISFVSQFLPVKAKVIVYPETEGKLPKIVASASIGIDKAKRAHQKATQELNVSPEQRISTSQPSDVPYSTEKTTSTTEVPKDYKSLMEEASMMVAILAHRAGEATQYLADHWNKNTTEPRLSFQEKLNFTIPPDLQEFDETVKLFLGKITKTFRDKRIRELAESQNVRTSTGTATRLNPRLVAKSANVPKQHAVKQNSVPEPPRSSPKEQKTTPPKTIRRYTLTQLNPRFIIKPADVPKVHVTEQKISVPRPISISSKVTNAAKLEFGQNVGSSISPSTKKAILHNYVRFLKVKSG